MLIKIILIVGCLAACAIASPLPAQKQLDARVLYDQRQEGEFNVRADLKNFVILIIPTSSTLTPPTNSPSLLDFLMKSLPAKTHVKRVKPASKEDPDAAQETMHFIESKTAPYHVDITKAKEQLEKLRPNNEEIIVARSPTVAFVKSDSETPAIIQNPSSRSARISRAFVFTVPADEEFVVTKTEDSKKVVKKDGKKKVIKDFPKQSELKLLGAENEQCGPGMERDSYGICRIFKYGSL